MLSDIEIAQKAKMDPIGEIAEKLDIPGEYLIPYGHTKAKVDLKYFGLPEQAPLELPG
jgi:formate--tetrahydrofolate ligase